METATPSMYGLEESMAVIWTFYPVHSAILGVIYQRMGECPVLGETELTAAVSPVTNSCDGSYLNSPGQIRGLVFEGRYNLAP